MAGKNIIKETEEFYNNFKILGLVTQITIHRLAWLLNHEFNWSLVRIGDVILSDYSTIFVPNHEHLEKNEQLTVFPIHSYKDEGNKFKVDLINNKYSSNIFFQELKQFDYIIIFEGEFDFLPQNLLERLKQFPPIQIVSFIENKKIKNKNLLLSYR
jgi:hypothetical protein